MTWAIMRESWRKGLPLLVAVGVSMLMLRGIASRSVGAAALDEAIQSVRLLAMLGLLPLLGAALGASRSPDADVTWVLARPIPRRSLAIARLVTDTSILAGCLAVVLAVLGYPERIATLELDPLGVGLTNPWVALVLACLVHGCTAALAAVGARPLAAAGLGVAWGTSMIAVPYGTLAAGPEVLSFFYVRWFSASEVLAWSWLGLYALVPIACIGVAWSMIAAASQVAPRAAPVRLLVRRSLHVQLLCLVVQVALLAYAAATIPSELRRGHADQDRSPAASR